MSGVTNSSIRRHLLAQRDLTLKQAYVLARGNLVAATKFLGNIVRVLEHPDKVILSLLGNFIDAIEYQAPAKESNSMQWKCYLTAIICGMYNTLSRG